MFEFILIVIAIFSAIGYGCYWVVTSIIHNSNVNKKENEFKLEIFNELGDALNGMTVDQIVKATGASSRRSIIARLSGRKLKCADFDGTIDRVKERAEQISIGYPKPEVICPHCAIKGKVFLKTDVEKIFKTTDVTNTTAAILSGTKATVEKVSQMYCKNCTVTWTI